MITEEQKQAFEKFISAVVYAREGEEIALLQTKEKGTGREALLVAYVTPPSEEDNSFHVMPLAELLVGNDIDRYENLGEEER